MGLKPFSIKCESTIKNGNSVDLAQLPIGVWLSHQKLLLLGPGNIGNKSVSFALETW